MNATVRIKDQWREQRIFEQRTVIAIVIILALTLALIARLAWLQIWKHEYYTDLSQGNRVRIEPLPASRGLILDRKGRILAQNVPAYQLELISEQVPDLDDALQRLAQLRLIEAGEIADMRRRIRARRKFESVPLKLRMSEEEVARFAVHRMDFPGVDIKVRLARSYPFGASAVHALGYVAAISEADLERIDRSTYFGTSLIGKLGVEAAYETQLHGRNGTKEVLVNAQGRSVDRQGGVIPELKVVPPIAGRDVILAMDYDVQRAAEAAIEGRRAAIVAIDPATGDVIALASQPGFDPNAFGRGLTQAEFDALQNDIDRPLFNRALKGVYPPGSTIKPIVAMAGLNYGVIAPSDSRFCRGFFTLPGSRHRFRDWKPQGHGRVDMVHAIAQSCDVYFYGLAEVIGAERLAGFLGHFGLGAVTGLDVGGEKSGLLPSPAWKQTAFANPVDKTWFPGETVIFGIGQGYLLATPMQMAHAASIIAARGKRYQPRLVTGLRDPASGDIERIAPRLVETLPIKDQAEWQIAIDGMQAVTTIGTARASARGAKFTIAGKTGTAQVFTVGQTEKYDASKIDERLRDHAWFIAFAPVEAPRIAVAVLVENGSSGSGTAAPIARKVLDAYLLPGVQDDSPFIDNQAGGE
ncbi:MAG: penicillin-binding protein 2 [Steroidobacteraceae bacterium]